MFIPKKLLARKFQISIESLDALINLGILNDERLVNIYLVTLYGIEAPSDQLADIPWMQLLSIAQHNVRIELQKSILGIYDSSGTNNDPMTLHINCLKKEINLWDGYANHSSESYANLLEFKKGMKLYLRKFNKMLLNDSID